MTSTCQKLGKQNSLIKLNNLFDIALRAWSLSTLEDAGRRDIKTSPLASTQSWGASHALLSSLSSCTFHHHRPWLLAISSGGGKRFLRWRGLCLWRGGLPSLPGWGQRRSKYSCEQERKENRRECSPETQVDFNFTLLLLIDGRFINIWCHQIDGEFFIEGRIIIHIRWTPEATVLRLLRLCQEAEMVEAGLSPNNAMLYAFTSKMKKMNQKKFQNFPKIQRPRRRVSGLCFTQTRAFRDVGNLVLWYVAALVRPVILWWLLRELRDLPPLVVKVYSN